MLAHAAGSKADIIARCGDFSHHPCGTRWPAAATRQTRYDIWGENLYYGSEPISSPRSALLAWLESPEHRAILFGRAWRDLGVTVHRARSLDGNPACPSGCSRSQGGSVSPVEAGDRRSARNRPGVAEQSHKREMSEAVRGDFERLRARRAGRNRPPQTAAPSERVVLTPAQPAPDPEPAAAEPSSESVSEQALERARGSWLRFARRRRQS